MKNVLKTITIIIIFCLYKSIIWMLIKSKAVVKQRSGDYYVIGYRFLWNIFKFFVVLMYGCLGFVEAFIDEWTGFDDENSDYYLDLTELIDSVQNATFNDFKKVV